MPRTFIRTFVIILSVFLAFQCGLEAGVEIGTSAPDFRLADTNGALHSLSDYAGKFVVLEWVNHECPFVQKHYNSGNMQSLQEMYTGEGVVWLSIGSSAPRKQGYFASEEWNELTAMKQASPSAVLLDPEGNVGRIYGAKTTPHMYIVDPQGTLIYQGAIDDIPSTDLTDIGRANNYVQLALEEALAGKPVSVSSTKSYGCSVKY